MTGIGEALLISAAASLISAGVSYALTPTQKLESGRINDLVPGGSSYGSPLPWGWGTLRLPGNKIWLDYLEEKKKKTRSGKGTKVQTTDYSYYGYWAEVYAECPFRPAVRYQRLWMNKKLTYSTIGGAETIAEGGKFAEQYLRFYLGLPAQEIDPLLGNKQPISSYSYGIPTNITERDAFLRSFGIDPYTANLTPGYNYRAYVVGQRVPLKDFFNAIPAGEAEIVFNENCTVGQIVADIFSLFYEPNRYDTSLLTTPVKGFSIDNVGAAKNALQTLQQAYFFDIVDSNGTFKFIPLNHPRSVVNLKVEDLAAHTGDNKPVDYEIIEADPSSLPSKVTVNYIDPDLNYDKNTQDSSLEVKGHYNPNPVQLSFNLVLSASEAATIADRALILAWINKNTYKFQLPPYFLNLEVADLVANVFDNSGLPIRLNKLRLGANLILDCEGVAHEIFFWNLVRQLEAGGVTLGVANYNVILQVSGTPTTVADSAGTIYAEGTDYTVTAEGNIRILSTGTIPAGTSLVVSTIAPPKPDTDTIGTIVSAGDTELLVLDIPLISNDDADYTLYLAAGGGASLAQRSLAPDGGAGSARNWSGASIYVSTDNSRYNFATTASSYSVFGTVADVVDGSNRTSRVSEPSSDTASSLVLTVSVNVSELESITDADVALGLNLALVGNLVVQFKTAELVEENTYRLSNITRGLRGTETQPLPATGDRFVLLTGESAELTKIVGSASDIGQTRYFKAVSSGQSLDEVEPVQIVYRGISQRPYAPVNLRATKNAVGDITVKWDRRDRHNQTENPPQLSEDFEQYLAYVLNSQGDPVRNQTTNSNSYIYLATEQVANFGSVQSTITVKIAQVSSQFGNGSFATATLTPILVEPPPTITSFTPASGAVGEIITVTGTNLAQVSEIKIGDIVQDNPAVANNTSASFVIAPGTVSGLIKITTTGGTATPGNPLIIEVEQTVAGHLIKDDTTTYPQRTSLKFAGNITVTDDATEDVTTIKIATPTGATSGTFEEFTHTTQALNNGAFENVDLEMPAVTALRQIDVSQPTRIRLFGTSAARTADIADISTQLQEASGLILDKLINSSYQFARGMLAQNCDDPVANFIYARIGNNSGTTGAISVGFKYYAIASVGTIEELVYLSQVDNGGLRGAWGIKYSSSYTGSAFTAYRADNNSSQNIGWNGFLPSQTELITFLGAKQGTVNTLFDSSGNNLDFSQATNSKKPLCSNSSGSPILANGKVAIQGDGVDDNLERSLISSSRSNMSFFLVVEIVSTSSKGCFLKQGTNFGFAIGQGASNFDTNGNNLVGLHETEEWIPTGYFLGTGVKLIQVIYNSSFNPKFYVGNDLIHSSGQVINSTPSGKNFLLGYNASDNSPRFSNVKLLAALIYDADKTVDLPNIRTYLYNLFNLI